MDQEIPDSSEESKAMAMSIINTLRELTKHNPLYSEEIPAHVREGVNPRYVDDFTQVFKLLFKAGPDA